MSVAESRRFSRDRVAFVHMQQLLLFYIVIRTRFKCRSVGVIAIVETRKCHLIWDDCRYRERELDSLILEQVHQKLKGCGNSCYVIGTHFTSTNVYRLSTPVSSVFGDRMAFLPIDVSITCFAGFRAYLNLVWQTCTLSLTPYKLISSILMRNLVPTKLHNVIPSLFESQTA